MLTQKTALAYVIGVALGDGNLSNPNGRAPRLRVTCDSKYPKVAQEISKNLRFLFPNNQTSIVKRSKENTYFDISVYSTLLPKWMPWKIGGGPKITQKLRVPKWIRTKRSLSSACLRGLLQTDGSIYRDRGYLMVNFCNHSQSLAADVLAMLTALGFKPTWHTTGTKQGRIKYTVRIARNAEMMVRELGLFKK